MTAPVTQRGVSSTAWQLDVDHTFVEFAVKHMMITTVRGRFTGVHGVLHLNADDPHASSVEVRIDAASIDTRTAQRDAHLRSPDFFDVERFPHLTFRSTRLDTPVFEPGGTFRVVGDLTIRDVTREVVLDVAYEGRGRDPWGTEKVSFSATTVIDRRDYGLTWNAALETGGVLVGNEVKIHLEVQASRDE